MRVVKDIPNPNCKITILAWNNRYLIKLEQGYFEQTFKVDEYDVTGDSDLDKIIDAEFIQQAVSRFNQMGQSLYEAKERASL